MKLSGLLSRPRFLPRFSAWNTLHGVRIGVTGQHGLLGSLLMARLADAKLQSVAFTGDVADATSISYWIETAQPDLLFHLAAIVPLQKVEADPVTAMRVNAVSLLAMSEAVAKFAPECWLFLASTSHVYETSALAHGKRIRVAETSATCPLSFYGASKLAGERIMIPLAEHFGTRLCIGRIFSFFHERQSSDFLVPNLVERVERATQGDVIKVRDADAVRDFLHADVVVDAMLHLCASRHTGIVNIGSGRAMSVGTMADRIVALSGKTVSVRRVPSVRRTKLVADVRRLRSIIAPLVEAGTT